MAAVAGRSATERGETGEFKEILCRVSSLKKSEKVKYVPKNSGPDV
jgi:hypothetical protein